MRILLLFFPFSRSSILKPIEFIGSLNMSIFLENCGFWININFHGFRELNYSSTYEENDSNSQMRGQRLIIENFGSFNAKINFEIKHIKICLFILVLEKKA